MQTDLNKGAGIKRSIPTMVFALAMAASATFIHLKRNDILDSFSFNTAVTFDQASLVLFAPAQDKQPDSYFVVFDSNKRIAQVDSDGALLQMLKPKSKPADGFYLANNLAIGSAGNLFIASTYINPQTLVVNLECIVEYDARGRYLGIRFSHEHDETDLVDNSGLIRALQTTPQGLRFCMLAENAIYTYELPLDGSTAPPPVRTAIPDTGATIQSIDLSPDGKKIAFTTATARLFVANIGDDPIVMYDGSSRTNTQISIPGHVRIHNDNIYFSDLGADNIVRLLPEQQTEPIFDATIAIRAGYKDRFYECKKFQTLPDGRLVLNNNQKIVDFNPATGECHVLQQARWDSAIWLVRAAYWLLLLFAISCAFMLLRRIILSADEAGRRMFKQMSLVLAMIVVATSAAVSMVFSNMNQQLNQLSLDTLRGYLELGRLLVDAQTVDRLQHVNHYMNEDYQNLLKQLQLIITRDGELQGGTYSGVYRVFDNKVTCLAYHDGIYGIFFPYDYDFEASIYAPVQRDGQIYMGEIADQFGVWQIGVAPITSADGTCVGLLEVGLDLTARQEAIHQLLIKTVISISMVLFVLIFIFLEIGFLSNHVLVHVPADDTKAHQNYTEGVLRFASYLAITGVFLSASFLPLFSKSLVRPIGGLPLDLVIGLPMVIETLCGALIAITYGHTRHRLGMKFDMILACLVVATGMFFTSRAASYNGLVAARIVVGMGMGLLMIAFRTYFLIESDATVREAGVVALTAGVVAGINTGSVSGGMIAARLGMRNVFLLQSVLLILAAIFVAFMLENRHRKPKTQAAQTISTWSFFFNRQIWSFFCLAFLPVTACGMFLGFFFPLFAETQGCTEEEISGAFMLFGLCGVYLGPSLTRMTSDALGARKAVFAGAMIMVAGLLFFAYTQTLTAAYFTVLLFGLTDSFIFNQGLNYLTSLAPVNRFGEDKAMGVYNVFESGGEAAGPIVFGLAMSFGIMSGVSLIAGVLAGSVSLFLLLSNPRKETTCQ